MKTKPRTGSAGGVAAVFLILAIFSAQTAPQPQIRVDNKPIPRDSQAVSSYAPIVEKVASSVVTVHSKRTVEMRQSPFMNDPMLRRFFGLPPDGELTPRERQERGLGSGVIVSPDGYIVSNSHVIEDADEVKVSLADNSGDRVAKVVGTDPQTDIAVLKIEGENLPAITLADSDTLRVGDVMLAVGNPFGVGQTVTMGIVSAVGRGGMGITDYEDFIQTDASINPGNSGGALVDAQGRLVGINTAILSRTGGNIGVGFAVPINLVRGVMSQIIETGKVRRGFLGVTVQPVTSELAKEFDLPDQNGALVGGVEPDSPASEAGLREGDVITKFDGKNVTDSRALRLIASQRAPGSEVELTYVRDGEEKTTSVTLGELPTSRMASAEEEQRRGGGGGREALSGVQVRDLNQTIRQQLRIPPNIEGALIVNVDPDSEAYSAGLRPGNVILEINRKKTPDAASAVEASEQAGNERVLLRVWSDAGSYFVAVEPETGSNERPGE